MHRLSYFLLSSMGKDGKIYIYIATVKQKVEWPSSGEAENGMC